MRKIKYWLSFWCFFGVMFSVNAQIERDLKNAYQLFKSHHYEKAIKAYQDILQTDSQNPNAIYYLGISLLHTKRNQEAALIFDSLEHIAPNYFEDFDFWKGKNNYLISKFYESRKCLQQYEKNGKNKKHLKLSRQLMPYVQTAIQLSKSKKDYKIESLNQKINSPSADFGALIFRNRQKLIFNRQAQSYLSSTHSKSRKSKTQIFYSMAQPNDEWSQAMRAENQNTSSHHDIALQLIKNDKEILICQDGDLKISKLTAKKWKIPQLLSKKINSFKNKNSACLYHQGKRIIFSSKNQRKNFDLFQSSKQKDGSWSKPKPITELNTSKNEGFPYITNHGKTLYFSSQGHQNIGGYDIFVSHYNPVAKQWSKPKNMGIPINSPMDDYYFSIQNKMGYLTSNRIGGYGMEDIYRFYLFSRIKVRGKVLYRNKETKPCQGCKIVAQSNRENYETTTDSTGKYTLPLPFHQDLKIRIYHQEKLFYHEDIRLTINPKRPNYQHRNYYIKYHPIEEKKARIQGKIFDKNTKKVLSAHVQLIDPITKKVIQSVKVAETGKYTFLLPSKTHDYHLKISQKGYFYTRKLIRSHLAYQNIIKENIALEKLKINDIFTLQNVNFKKESDILTSNSFEELNQLAYLLRENATLKIEIAGHTEAHEDKGFSLLLSDKKAKAVKNYLVGQGIDNQRIKTMGYGDTRPLSTKKGDKKYTPKNRRIEIEILSF